MKRILLQYQQASGQLVNLDKSEISFSRNTPTDRQNLLQGWMNVKAVENHSKYLGLPTFVGRSKRQVFDFIQERVWKKLKGWKETMLSQAGQEVLIKSVAQAIPTYIMGCFLIPQGLCDHIESLISRFWWGSKNGERKIHWVKWSKLCDKKVEGGMGFRNFRAFNLSILAKQGWRILKNPDSLMARTMRARYFPRQSFLHAKTGFMPSYTWRSIHEATWMLKKGGYWRVGNGVDIHIWKDAWLPTQNGNRLWTPPNALDDDARVLELIDHEHGVWREELIRSCFYPFEASQILALPLPAYNREDSFCWQGTISGDYKTSSAYHLIKSLKQNEPESSNQGSGDRDKTWERIWKANIPPRSRMFFWRLLHNILPVMKNLESRGVSCLPFCPRCMHQEESVSHAIFTCKEVAMMWFHHWSCESKLWWKGDWTFG